MKDGMNYLPEMQPAPVVGKNEFCFAASHFDHGHIYGQITGLVQAGGTLRAIYEPRSEKLEPLKDLIGSGVRLVERFEDLLEDDEIRLITAAAIPNQRCGIGLRVMDAGKDYFTDKSPFTTLEQLELARAKVTDTGQKYMVCYSERLENEAAWQAGELIAGGAIGRILQVLIMAPHNLNAPSRPDWFFDKECYGGILTDIGSHQFEQFLHYGRCDEATVAHAIVDNRANPDKPELEDVGQTSLILANGIQCFSRVNWFTPDGMRGWGDGRTFITGSRGVIEIRKYFDFGRSDSGDLILIADQNGDEILDVHGKVGFPFFGELILDCLHRTENAMTQYHAFQAARLSLHAQTMADAQRTN